MKRSVITSDTLRIERGRLGMSQRQLADAVGVTMRTVTARENGENPVPLTRNARLHEVLGTTPSVAAPDYPLAEASDLDLIGELMRRLSRNDARS